MDGARLDDPKGNGNLPAGLIIDKGKKPQVVQ